MSFLPKLALSKIAEDVPKQKTNDEYIDHVISANASVQGGVPKSQLAGAAAKDRKAGNVEQLRKMTADNVFNKVNGPVVADEVYGPGKNNVVAGGSTVFVDKNGNRLTRNQTIARLEAQGVRNEKAFRTPGAKQEAIPDSEFIDVADPTKREQLRKLLPTIARLGTTGAVSKTASADALSIRKRAGLFDFMKTKKEDKSAKDLFDELGKKREDSASVPGRRARLFNIMQK